MPETNHGGARRRGEGAQRTAGIDEGGVSGKVIGAAMEVHSVLGPGLLEGAYEECLVYELRARALACRRQVVLPIHYKGLTVGHGFRADLLVSDSLLVELKAVESILPVHQAQILTYLRLSRRRMGLLINFHARHLRDGIQRFVVDPPRDASVL